MESTKCVQQKAHNAGARHSVLPTALCFLDNTPQCLSEKEVVNQQPLGQSHLADMICLISIVVVVVVAVVVPTFNTWKS